jgi:HYR domain
MTSVFRWLASVACALAMPLVFATGAPTATQLEGADTTPPSITPDVSGTAGAGGWFTTPATVTWTVADPDSGIATSSGCAATTVSGDTTGQTLTCSATNTQGLSAQVNVVVKVDTTGPGVTADPTSKPQEKGWYTQPLTVAFAGADSISAIAGCTGPVGYSGPDTKSAAVGGSCTNGAGLSTSAIATFKYDSTAPDVTPSISGKLGANGWYVGDVSVNWAVSDSVSDVASSSGCAATTLTADTAGMTLTCSATNGAGLTTQRSVTVKIDRSAPETTLGGGPSGTVTSATASFSFSASEAGATFACSLDGGGFEPCSSPQSYTGLADGSHSFRVRATDAAGNADQTPAERAWTVRAALPHLELPPAQTVEATTPAGTSVTYTAKADSQGEPIAPDAIACKPPSGSTFPLGATTVTCSVTNAYGVSASGSFVITVVDTTAPRLTAPTPLTLSASGALSRTNASIAAFLAGARAVDLVDTHVAVTSDAPATFPFGTTVVKFTARDASGNTASSSSSITVQQAQAGSSGAGSGSSSAPDRTPPGDVRQVEARPGDRSVTLSWQDPPDADFHQVDVFRSLVAPGATETRIYTGGANKLVDRGLDNGTQYQYIVVAIDKAGNRAAGVVATATPKAALLLAPKNGARLSRPPVLVWLASPGAAYYNVQLWRGARKIFTAWPLPTRLALPRQWRFEGRRFSLTPGAYRWYVWPGVGDRADVNYGPLLGMNTFTIVPRKHTR